MCGFAGIMLHDAECPVDRRLLEQMNKAQRHRGPDGSGLHLEPGLGLAHRRLSIIDIEGGSQPIYNEDESVVVVYNGEIYNFRELRRELQHAGHRFRTDCDTEVIVHAWEQWGEDCVLHFRGMFAFALWDAFRELLFLARDRFGIKPLHYSELTDGTLVFGSELKALLMIEGLSRELEPKAVEEYFAFGYVPDPHTILKDVYKLAPGHRLAKQRGRKAFVNQYWNLSCARRDPVSVADAQDELVPRLLDAVQQRLIADVPLGAFLSGGVDSSAVVAMMQSAASTPIQTCSIGFTSEGFDEASYARLVSNHLATRHHVCTVDSDSYELLDHLIAIHDEPFADSSALPTYRLCELARQHVKVCLSGDGADETFAGYAWYKAHLMRERVRASVLGPCCRRLFATLGAVAPKADWAPRFLRAKTTFETLAGEPLYGLYRSLTMSSPQHRKSHYSRRFRAELQGYDAIEILRGHAARFDGDDPLALAQYLDFNLYLPSDILTKVDRASMAQSLEVRVPFLDHQLVEWVLGLPPHFRLHRTQGKHILKKALGRYLPPEILYRRKMGFSIPLSSWIKGPLRNRVQDAIESGALHDLGLFDVSKLRKLLAEHLSGLRNNSELLWAFLSFESFVRQHNQRPRLTTTPLSLSR